MASSSAHQPLNNSYQYDVFLSFNGEDTRRTFIDHLYEALQRQGIHTFKDDERLQKGKKIKYELLKSIEDSKFCIIVFSKKYASSSWCLDELVKLMECHEQTAYPVFYDVEPSEVRKKSGSVGEALTKHTKKTAIAKAHTTRTVIGKALANHTKKKLGKWKKAPTEAANLSGWDLRNTADGHEAKVIKLIVERISLELCSISLNIDETLIGMEHRLQDLESSLEIGSNEVRMIGIRGMGGSGKTTLARAIFDRLSIQFETKCFVENVREISKASLSGLLLLQKQIISDLLKVHGSCISSLHDGKNMMKKKLSERNVLLVLDDVDHINQLEVLDGDPNWFKPGSRIIITTRDEQVLIAHRVKCICGVSLLSDEEATCLFNRHAFGKNIPIQGYENLAEQVVNYAAGLPLTIKVLGGSFLCGKDKPEWIDAIQRLKTIPEKETLKKLELSYESLEDDYRKMFLEVACLLKGWDKYKAIRLLESCGFHARSGLKVLEQKSLIIIIDNSYEEIIDMHDHIEEMGKNIVRRLHPDEPNKHSHLWIQEEIEDVLRDDMGTENTRSISLKLTPEIVTVGLENIGNMKNLRCLVVDYRNYNNDFRDLVKIDEVLKKLKSLELRYSKLRTFDLALVPNVERLDLLGCYDLEELHVPNRCLNSLVYLNLYRCSRLKSLLFIKQVESLEVLHLGGLDLMEFPDIIPEHSNSSLLELSFQYNDIEELPPSIGNLHKLVYLNLTGCKKLKSLPGRFCSLQQLSTVYLDSYAIECW